MSAGRGPDRRSFVKALAGGAAAWGAMGGPATAQEAKPAGDAADPVEREIELRMQLVLARYGERLDDEARKAVRGEVAGIVRRARRLRSYPLGNGDGPMPVLVPFRGPAE